jgi:hypothetical protein
MSIGQILISSAALGVAVFLTRSRKRLPLESRDHGPRSMVWRLS